MGAEAGNNVGWIRLLFSTIFFKDTKYNNTYKEKSITDDTCTNTKTGDILHKYDILKALSDSFIGTQSVKAMKAMTN